ncbi:MAG: hypothetical protein QW448_09235 [Thermofilaceae archaeon]
MKLYKLRVHFLPHSFLPISPIREHWTATHTHLPPSTLSGLFLRAVLFSVNPRNVYGDYAPCRIGKGLLLRLKGMHAEWFLAEREEVIEGAKPPYLEYHFNAVSLGAYDEATLLGKPSIWGFVEKYWNTLKYIDDRMENLRAPFHVGIKTWFFAAADGARLSLPGVKGKRMFMTYDVVKVRFDIPPSHLYGFILVDDAKLEPVVELLFNGWFIDKSRLKTLVAVKLEEVLVPATEKTGKLYVIPSIRMPRRPVRTVVSSLISRDALAGRRRDVSTEKGFLYIEKPEDVNLDDKLLFKGRDGFLYAVDKSWLDYLKAPGRSA